MTLTVRLDAATESALERYIAERGVTKSLVVQESLAVYLLAHDKQPDVPRAGAAEPSDNYKAFAAAGLIGAVALGLGSDKAAVRTRVQQAFEQRKARRGGA